jgi:hypothetical protein
VTERSGRTFPAWAWGLVATLVTLVGLIALGVGAVMLWPGNEEARMDRISEGAARFSLFVGVGVGFAIHRRRSGPRKGIG